MGELPIFFCAIHTVFPTEAPTSDGHGESRSISTVLALVRSQDGKIISNRLAEFFQDWWLLCLVRRET